MSYDLMVFEPSAAPRERTEFITWYKKQTEWAESHDYDDPAVTSAGLRAWYAAMTSVYPNMNTADISDDAELEKYADYSIGREVIYGAFAWSEAEDVYTLVRRLAVEHKVGFYDVSGDEGNGEIYFPGDALRMESGGTWRSIAAEFRAARDQEKK